VRQPHPRSGLGKDADTPGRARARAGFVPYAGDGYAMLLPGKWNPSKEREFAGMDVRCVEPAQAGAGGHRASRACD
jgi:hypothetical protein